MVHYGWLQRRPNPGTPIALLSMGLGQPQLYHPKASKLEKATSVDGLTPLQLVPVDEARSEDPILCDTEVGNSANNLNLSYLVIGPKKNQIGVNWLANAFPSRSISSSNDDKCITSSGFVVYVIFVIGDKCGDFLNFCEKRGRELTDHIKIACVSRSTPGKRARILLGGFDDVFDMERMQGVEARARVDAITQRFVQVRRSRQIQQLKERRLNAVASMNELTTRELDLIEILVEREGDIVPYDFLMERMKNENGPLNRKHLGVVIHNFRKKLLNGYQIMGVRGEGYVLQEISVS